MSAKTVTEHGRTNLFVSPGSQILKLHRPPLGSQHKINNSLHGGQPVAVPPVAPTSMGNKPGEAKPAIKLSSAALAEVRAITNPPGLFNNPGDAKCGVDKLSSASAVWNLGRVAGKTYNAASRLPGLGRYVPAFTVAGRAAGGAQAAASVAGRAAGGAQAAASGVTTVQRGIAAQKAIRGSRFGQGFGKYVAKPISHGIGGATVGGGLDVGARLLGYDDTNFTTMLGLGGLASPLARRGLMKGMASNPQRAATATRHMDAMFPSFSKAPMLKMPGANSSGHALTDAAGLMNTIGLVGSIQRNNTKDIIPGGFDMSDPGGTGRRAAMTTEINAAKQLGFASVGDMKKFLSRYRPIFQQLTGRLNKPQQAF